MARQTIDDGDSGSTVRTKLNAMTSELYALAGAGSGGGIARETQGRSEGSPSSGDPLDIATVTHTMDESYTSVPPVVIQPKCDWDLYLSSVSVSSGTLTVVVGVGGSGTATESDFDYDIVVFG